MFSRIAAALVVVVAFAGVSRAEEYKATVKKVDADKNSIVVTIGSDDKTFTVAKDAEIYTQAKGKKNKPGAKNPVDGGLSGVKEGAEVTLTTIKSGDNEIISSIKVETPKKKKKTDK